MLIDTLTIVQNLTEAGIPDAHAKAIAKEYAHLMQHQIDQFATKEDLKHLEVRLDAKIDSKIDNAIWQMKVNSWSVGATVAGLLFTALKMFH